MGEAILWAVKNGELDSVKTQIGDGGVDVNAELSGGRCPLHFASDYGQLEVCEYLISKGANLDQPDKHGITPLLAAIWEDHLEVCKLLISKGADKNGKAPDGVDYIHSTGNEAIKALLK